MASVTNSRAAAGAAMVLDGSTASQKTAGTPPKLGQLPPTDHSFPAQIRRGVKPGTADCVQPHGTVPPKLFQ